MKREPPAYLGRKNVPVVESRKKNEAEDPPNEAFGKAALQAVPSEMKRLFMDSGILSLVGNTPIVELSHFSKNLHFHLFAKLEAFNPGGSIKDRPALNIIKAALASGDIRAGSTIIESSSGNMGIGLAQACRYYGMRLICVVDAKTTAQNVAILKAYG